MNSNARFKNNSQAADPFDDLLPEPLECTLTDLDAKECRLLFEDVYDL